MDYQAFTGEDPCDPEVQMLITVWEDGTATIATRRDSGTWGPPHDLDPA
jgi:hypothetical protein